MFRKIPMDSTALRPRVGGEVVPVQAYVGDGANRHRTGEQATDEKTGHPLWRVDLFTIHDGRAVVFAVKFPSAVEPQLELEAPVRVEGLTCTVVDRTQYFAARAVTPVAVKQG